MTAGGSAALWRCQQGTSQSPSNDWRWQWSMASAGTYQAIAVDGGGALDRVSHWTASHWYWILLDTSGTFKIPMDEWHPRDSGCRWNGHSVASFSSQGSRKQPILWYHMGVAGEKCCVRWTSNSSSTSHNPCPHELPQIATGDHLRQVLQLPRHRISPPDRPHWVHGIPRSVPRQFEKRPGAGSLVLMTLTCNDSWMSTWMENNGNVGSLGSNCNSKERPSHSVGSRWHEGELASDNLVQLVFKQFLWTEHLDNLSY